MKKLFALIFLLLINFSFSQGLKTSGKKIVDKFGNEVLLRGMGPGGWLVMEGYMNPVSYTHLTLPTNREV